MKCEKCNVQIENGEEREHQGRVLCEDCYIDALSTVKPCDPWAVYCAKSFDDGGSGSQLTRRQKDILAVLKKTDGIEQEVLAEKLGWTLTEL